MFVHKSCTRKDVSALFFEREDLSSAFLLRKESILLEPRCSKLGTVDRMAMEAMVQRYNRYLFAWYERKSNEGHFPQVMSVWQRTFYRRWAYGAGSTLS
jgi:hypothetical protein